MPAFHRLAALAAAIALLAPVTAHALDDDNVAASSKPIALTACNGSEDDTIKPLLCKKQGYDVLATAIDTAFKAALAKAPANVKPLLKRDEVWFDEIILAAGDDGLPDGFADTLRQRAASLGDIASGFGRAGYSGHWANALGQLDLTPADGGAYRLVIETATAYGSDDRSNTCKV